LHAAIAAEHARAPSFEATDWRRIVAWYDALLTLEPSPTIAVGRCVALSYAVGPDLGLADLDEVLALGGLDTYPYAHAARAQILERLGRAPEAAESWAVAAQCARTDAEQAFFAGRQAY
jgi:RNA polymerase sigma-70 factor (ECF subfamily)